MESKIRSRLLLIIAVIQAFFVVFILTVSGFVFQSKTLNYYANSVMDISHEIASMLDGNKLQKYIDNPVEDDDYRKMGEVLTKLKSNYDDLRFLAVFLPVGSDEIIYIYDIYTNEELSKSYISEHPLGYKREFANISYEGAMSLYRANADYRVYDIIKTETGECIAGYSSVFNDEGNMTSIVACGFDMSLVKDSLVQYLFILGFALIIPNIIISFVFYNFCEVLFVKPICQLSDETRNFIKADGDSEVKSDKNAWEINKLDDSMHSLMKKVELQTFENQELKKKNDIYEKHNSFVSLIQNDMFEKALVRKIENDNLLMVGNILYRDDYSGDFYDCIKIDNKYAILFAGVMERDVASAFYMLFAKSLIEKQLMQGLDPVRVLDVTNNQLSKDNDGAMFIRAVLGIYDPEKSEFSYSSAAGIEPFVIRKDGSTEKLKQEKECMPLGVFEDTPYTLSTVNLKKGDKLVFYRRRLESTYTDDAYFEIEELSKEILKGFEKEDGNGDNIIPIIEKEIKEYTGISSEDLEYALMIINIK